MNEYIHFVSSSSILDEVQTNGWMLNAAKVEKR